MKRHICILTLIFIIFVNINPSVFAKDNFDEFIKNGNSLYKQNKFKDAEIEYRKGLDIQPNSNIAKYNLGTSLYRQNQFDEAMNYFNQIDNSSFKKKNLASAFHNLGNSYLQNKQYEESIKAYQKALLNNPKDLDTKYNLEYAKRMLQQQMQSQNKNQDKQNQDKQNQDKQNQDKQNQDKQNQDKQNQDKQNQDKQQKDKPKISKEDAERILQALMNKEKELQKKMKVQKATKGKSSRNW